MINKIDQLATEYCRIIGYYLWNDRAEFVRIKPVLSRLIKSPKYIPYPKYVEDQLYTRWSYIRVKQTELLDDNKALVEWLLKNTTGKFTIHYTAVSFELKKDHMLFKLTFT